ncbi:MAG TPA: TrbI/VirB10 family protein [Alphaproteobacteria bacterium]|nr:TrbI/VirB10 family protein [Alphaproteobacteria bacterium]
MTNNNDDFEQHEHDFNPTEELAPPQGGMKANLAEAWRSRPLFKLIVLMIAVAAIVAASVSFFGGSSNQSTSHLVNPPSLNAPPGGPSSPYMQQQTNLANQERENQALQNGSSALPTPIGQTTDIGELGNTKKDQLSELRAEVEKMKQDQKQTQLKQAQQPAPGQPGAPQQRPEQFDDTLAQAMQRQLNQLMDSWTPHGIKTAEQPKDALGGAIGANGTTVTGNGSSQLSPQQQAAADALKTTSQAKTLVAAGTVSYAQLLTEANSDVPGPILAQILSGPFAGARAVGQFQISAGYADYLVLQFTLVNFKGKDYPINAIALDPDTTLGGMATEVNQRYFTRVILPAAAGFLQGFGQAIGQGNQSLTTNGTTTVITQSNQGIHQGIYQGLGTAAQTASQFFQNQANQVKPLVVVGAGTAMGLFFVQSAMDTTVQEEQQLAAQNAAAGLPAGYGLTGYSPTGAAGYPGMTNPLGGLGASAYPGTTVNGYGSTANSSVPYPNYGNAASTQRSFSPYSAFPSVSGLGTTGYGQ